MKERIGKIMKIILLAIIIVLFIIQIIGALNEISRNVKVEAASNSGNTSDVQLLARAINRRSKRRAI